MRVKDSLDLWPHITFSHYRYIFKTNQCVAECRTNVAVKKGEQLLDHYVSPVNGTLWRKKKLKAGSQVIKPNLMFRIFDLCKGIQVVGIEMKHRLKYQPVLLLGHRLGGFFDHVFWQFWLCIEHYLAFSFCLIKLSFWSSKWGYFTKRKKYLFINF